MPSPKLPQLQSNSAWDNVHAADLTIARETVHALCQIGDKVTGDGSRTELFISAQLETIRSNLSAAIEDAEEAIATASDSLVANDASVFELTSAPSE